MKTKETTTVIIGASAAGLACAACLSKYEAPFLLVEQSADVAHPWRQHYERLHLNTHKKVSSLPFLDFPPHADPYISRDEVVAYMEQYAKKFNIQPEFNQAVTSVRFNGSRWEVRTSNRFYLAEHVIVATGSNRVPFYPHWPGMENFRGPVIHSSAYKNGEPYAGQQVLVVGFGNSACEISICLHEYGAFPSLSVKGAVNIVPRGNGNSKVEDFFDSFSWVTKLVPALIDSINAPSLRSRYGDYTRYGLQKLPYGPNVQIVKHKRIPVLDIGAFDLIKNGSIRVYPGIRRFTDHEVEFTDGSKQPFDAVILGTGYRCGLSEFLLDASEVTDEDGWPLQSGRESALKNLYFCGFRTSPQGMLKQIGIEARSIARAIHTKYKRNPG